MTDTLFTLSLLPFLEYGAVPDTIDPKLLMLPPLATSEDYAILAVIDPNHVPQDTVLKRKREEADSGEPTKPPRLRAKTSPSTPSQSSTSSSPPHTPPPLEPSTEAVCRWRIDGQRRCGHTGTAQEVWDHILADHYFVHAPPEIPNGERDCEWPGCAQHGTPEYLADKCTAVHKRELAESTADHGKVRCLLCPENKGWLALAAFARHLKDQHYSSSHAVRYCHMCGHRMRKDSKSIKTHPVQCLKKFMKTHSEFQ
ncbi:hypothetical protein C8Q72DRAFT_293677 [Fomitopsis betulina]|nr:hypothetical protein C8Q72DRAFT_293677 [Fomitopsis betulina]